MNVSVLAVVFRRHFLKNRQFQPKLLVFWRLSANTTTSTETFTESSLRHSFALHFTSHLFIALSKILPHSKTIKNAKKLSVFGENDSCRLSNFLQTRIFWNFDHISRIYNQINYRNIWFPKVIIILSWRHKCFFLTFFSEKDLYLNAVESSEISNSSKLSLSISSYYYWLNK